VLWGSNRCAYLSLASGWYIFESRKHLDKQLLEIFVEEFSINLHISDNVIWSELSIYNHRQHNFLLEELLHHAPQNFKIYFELFPSECPIHCPIHYLILYLGFLHLGASIRQEDRLIKIGILFLFLGFGFGHLFSLL